MEAVGRERAAAAAPDLRQSLDSLRARLVDSVCLGAAILALFYAPVLFWRAQDVGWSFQLRAHALMIVFAWTLPWLARRLPLALKSALLVSLMVLLGVVGLFSLGMAGTGYWWLYQAAMLVAVLFSVRAGVAAVIVVALLVALAGVGYVSGAIVTSVDLGAATLSASAWSAFVAVLLFAPLILVLAIGGYQAMLQRLVAEVTAQRNELARVAAHDQLTGLPLLHLATDRLEMATRTARRTGDKVAVLFLDLDGFKAVNDRLGHEAGNAVLKAIGARLRKAVREEDTVARVGGDEFVVVLGRIDGADAAARVAEKILTAIAVPVAAGEAAPAEVQASIGIALFPDHGTQAADLWREADRAMYAVKKDGKNAFRFAGA